MGKPELVEVVIIEEVPKARGPRHEEDPPP